MKRVGDLALPVTWIIVTLVMLPATSRAVESISEARPEMPADSALAFAEFLVSSDHASLATGEYLRCLWKTHWDDSATTKAAINGVARAYVLSGQYQDAISWARRNDVRAHASCSPEEFQLLAATAALRLERPREAAEFFTGPTNAACSPDSTLMDRSAYLEGVCEVHLGRWQAASIAFERVRPFSPLAVTSHQYAALALEGGSLPHRSPRVARWLGLLPGAGYFYSGFHQTGVSALIVNLVFAEGAREAFRHSQPTLGGFLTAFEVSWYAGSIYGSGKSAQRYNEYYRTRFTDRFAY